MATDAELNIILRIKDEMSKGLNIAQAASVKFADQIQEAGEKLSKVGREMSRFGGDLSQIGGIVTGGFTAALIKASEHSEALRDGFQSLKNAGQSLADTIGTALTPLFQRVVTFAQGLVNVFNTMNPQLRDQIIQWTAIAGVMAVVGGSILWVGGKMLDLAGNALQVIGVFARFAAVNPVLIGVIAATVLLMAYWEQLKGVVMRVVDYVEIGVNSIHAGFRIIISKMAEVLNWLVIKMRNATALLLDMYDSMGQQAPVGLEKMRASLNVFSKNINDFVDNQKVMIDGLSEYTGDIMSGTSGKVSQSFDDAMTSVKDSISGAQKAFTNFKNTTIAASQTMGQKFSKGFSDGIDAAKMKLTDFYSYGKQVGEGLAEQFQSTLGDYFYNVFKGDMDSAKDAFKAFGDYCLKMISEIIAKMLIAKAINMYEGSNTSSLSTASGMLGSQNSGGGDSWFSGLLGGGSSAGGSSGGIGGMGIFAAVLAGIVAQEAATRHTNREFDGVETGNAFSGQFATEPWFAWMNQEMGVAGATAGESFDAAIKNHDWGKAFRTSFNALDYWFDPMSNWLDSLFKGIIGEEAYEKYNLQTFIDPISQIFDLFTDFEGTLESLIDPFGSIQESIEETNDVLDKAGMGIHDFKDALKMLDPVTYTIYNKFDDLKDNMGAVAASMFPLESIIYKMTDGFKSFGGVLQWVDPIMYGVINGFGKIGDSLSDLWGTIKDLLGNVPGSGFGGGGGFDIGDVFDPIGIFQTGTRYIPESGYAYVHKGEEITRANEVANRDPGGNVTINLNISAIDGASVQKIFPQIAEELVKTLKRNGSLRGAILNV